MRVSVSAGLLGGAALVAVGVVAALVLSPAPVAGSATEGSTGRGSVLVTVEPYDGAREVSVRTTVTPEESLTVAATGRVTASACAPGAVITSGEVALVLDDQPIVALATEVPLWRDLRTGTRGDDVRSLQAELARLGHDLVPDGHFGTATREAVRAIQRDAGVERADGALAAGSVVWLPRPDVSISDCLVHVGDTVSPGEIATVAGGLTVLAVVDAPADEGWVVRLDGVTGPVGVDGVVTDPALLAVVEQSEAYRQAQDAGEERLTMEIALAEQIDVAVVPPSAVLAAGNGQGCVQPVDGAARRVEIVASSLGQTMVRVDGGPAPRSVLVRPDDHLEC